MEGMGMWEREFYYEDIVFLEPDKNLDDCNRTKQELLLFNILLPKAVPNRPTIVCKSESPDFITYLSGGERLYVEVVTAVAVAHENAATGGPGINLEWRRDQIRKGERDNKPYTTNSGELAQIVAREIKKKRCLARKWVEKRPIILLVGLVGVSGLFPDFYPQKHVNSIHPFSNVIIGDGTILTHVLQPTASTPHQPTGRI
jgi:hypothetical protein